MMPRVIQLSEGTYRLLHDQATRLQVTPEQVIEWLLATDLPAFVTDDMAVDVIPAPGSEMALEAVHRLTTLFAALPLPNIHTVLNDPLIMLANADFTDLL